MPTPLTARSPGKISLLGEVLATIFIGIPLVGLGYCFTNNRQVHFDDPWLNLCAHAALILFPLTWLWLMTHSDPVYESSDTDIVLGKTSYFGSLRSGWWAMFMIWATPVFAAVAFGRALESQYLRHPQDLSTPPARAAFIMAVIFGLGLFYSTILLGRSTPATWVWDEGLRTGILRFFKWEDIHHLSRHENLYTIYHHVNPALPATAFKVYTRESQEILERFLSEHQVRISNDSDPAYLMVKIAVVSGFVVNLLADFWLQSNSSLSLTSILLISFAIGIVMTVVLEKYRGVSKYGKYKPVLQFDDTVASDGNQP